MFSSADLYRMLSAGGFYAGEDYFSNRRLKDEVGNAHPTTPVSITGICRAAAINGLSSDGIYVFLGKLAVVQDAEGSEFWRKSWS